MQAALGSDFYGGTSGVAWFLAELFAATDDTEIRRTALGAIEQALFFGSDEIPADGLYRGRLGVAVAAARVGTLLQAHGLLDRAAAIAAASAPQAIDCGFDIISGRAGGIIGHLIMHAIVGDAWRTERAVTLADELCALDIRDDRWSPRSNGTARPLTGFSHGAAGVGYALMTLASATGESKYRRAADLAFAYERSVFDRVKQNWPDFRQQRRCGNPYAQRAFATEWCHGAPGIALSRLHAYQHFGDKSYLAEADVGITTTRRAVTARLDHIGNYCLCHGLAGSAEVLLRASEILGSSSTHNRSVADQVAESGIQRYAGPGQSWPCGVRGGTSPSLMTGLAGIGHFYLRLHDRTVPSVLQLQPESFRA